MASKISRRRAGGEQDNTRPHKRARLSPNDSSAQFDVDVFGASFAKERNNEILALHNAIQLPAKINGGHIRASVVDVTEYPNRKSAGLLLKLGPSTTDPEAPRLLACELMHPKVLECQQPARRDTVYIALTEAKLGINDKDDELCFKLRFETSLIYIVPFERDDANPAANSRILKLVDIGKNAPQTRKDASPSLEKDHVTTEESHSTSHPLPTANPPVVSHKVGRTRKRDTRHANNRQDLSDGPTHKAARKLSTAAKKAILVTDTSPLVGTGALSAPEDTKANSPPPLGEMESPAVDTARDPGPVSDENQAVEVQGHEELSTSHQDKKIEPSRGGFVSDNGIKFLALDELKDLPQRTPVNVIGVVEWMADIKNTRNNQFLRVFRLSDQTMPDFCAQLFTKKLQWMPNVQVGQILLLHNTQFEIYQGKPMVIGPAATLKWIAYDPQTKQTFFSEDPTGPKYQYLDQRTKEYFATLADNKTKILNDPNHVVIAPPSTKHKLLSELIRDRFFDATVEVLSVEHVSWGVEIFVTDYTKGELLDDNQNSPWGAVGRKRALRLEVWPEERNSYGAACLLKPGKFYLIKNFTFRLTKNYGWAGKIVKNDNAEFRQLREDSQDPDLRRLLERRAAFNHTTVDEDIEVSGTGDVFLGNPMDANQASSSVAEAKPVPVEEVLSGHRIACELASPYTDFKTIKDDPRCHVEYRIRGRITDITPPHPREMIQLRCANCQEIVTASRKEPARCSLCNSTSVKLDVSLSLLVVDEGDESLSVIISGDEAKHFFGMSPFNPNASDLSLASVAEDMVGKLRNVVGNLWVDGPCFKPFVEENKTSGTNEIKGLSPWIDLAIRSWHVKDLEASSVQSSCWVRKYSLFKCAFQV